jgi:hypothetical protein
VRGSESPEGGLIRRVQPRNAVSLLGFYSDILRIHSFCSIVGLVCGAYRIFCGLLLREDLAVFVDLIDFPAVFALHHDPFRLLVPAGVSGGGLGTEKPFEDAHDQ